MNIGSIWYFGVIVCSVVLILWMRTRRSNLNFEKEMKTKNKEEMPIIVQEEMDKGEVVIDDGARRFVESLKAFGEESAKSIVLRPDPSLFSLGNRGYHQYHHDHPLARYFSDLNEIVQLELLDHQKLFGENHLERLRILMKMYAG